MTTAQTPSATTAQTPRPSAEEAERALAVAHEIMCIRAARLVATNWRLLFPAADAPPWPASVDSALLGRLLELLEVPRTPEGDFDFGPEWIASPDTD